MRCFTSSRRCCYGSPNQTHNVDVLAAGGLRYTNPGLPVTPEYPSPFKFASKIYSVTVDVSGELIKDTEAELRLVMARQ